MKDYKSIVEQRRADHDRAAAEIRAAIDENKAKIEKLYATQAKAIIDGDSAAYSTAESEIKFLKATNDQQQKELEALEAACVLLTKDEYRAAGMEALNEQAAKRAAMIKAIEKKWGELYAIYAAYASDAVMTNGLLKYLKAVSGSDNLTPVDTAEEMKNWITRAESIPEHYQAFR